jgi:Protein of unknown function (DUF3306)
MSEPENFLSRWARLKREAAEEAEASPDAAAPDATAEEARVDAPAAEATETLAPEPAFDISKLPPIESITATTDIRAFLAPGVPPDLARAALRRAWVADPAIRDFVGIAENQWDFNDPNAIPGFGSLGPLDDVRRLVAQVFGGTLGQSEDVAAAEKSSAVAAPSADSIAPEGQESEGDLPRPEGAQQSRTLAPAESGGERSIATQQGDTREQSTASAEVPPRRPHGGALPQ